MIVRLDLKRDGETIADGDDTSILSGSLQDVRRLGRKAPQKGTRVLVGAVLAPECADDAQLGEGRRPSEHLLDALVFLDCQTMLGDERRRDRRITGARKWRHLSWDDGRSRECRSSGGSEDRVIHGYGV